MMEELDETSVDQLRVLLQRWLGHELPETRMPELATLITDRVQHHGFRESASYLEWLSGLPTTNEERRFFAENITVGETHFFRLGAHFDALRTEVLPERLEARRLDRTVRIVSAGCASGEEPYSLAITAHELMPEPATWTIRVRGIDINRSLLARARRARYSEWSLRDTPREMRERYFRKNGGQYVLSDEIRRMVSFEERNLFDWGRLQLRGEFDVVFCRNVGIYMTHDAMKQLVALFENALAPGGFLFLGHAESLRGLSDAFELRQHGNGFFYRLRGGKPKRASTSQVSTWEPRTSTEARDDVGVREEPEPPPLAEKPVVSPAKRRTRQTSRSMRPKTLPGARANATPFDYRRMLELLQQDKDREALALLDRLSPDQADLPKARLVRAVILANRARYDEAEALCRSVMDDDARNAAACHVLSLCRAARNDASGALIHAQQAIEIDPAFGFAHLQMGLLTKRNGERDVARRELRTALELLGREEASHIVLFGGGFSRHALMELCRTELVGC